MTINNTKFYYDKVHEACLPFEYGGCRGNENNFDSKQKCEDFCSLMKEESLVRIDSSMIFK
jgi:hypothetical protein